MITLLLGICLAAPDGGAHTHTAETLDAGAWLARFPTGPSAVGLSDRTELWTIPVDIGIGGPRVGLETQLVGGDLAWSLRPSVGLKTTGRRASTRLDSSISATTGSHRLSLTAGADLRLLRRYEIGPDPAHTLTLDRVQVPLTLVHDWTPSRHTLRSRLNLPLRDRGQTLTYASGSVSWLHAFGRVHTETGVGLLVGRPRDQWTLGTYRWSFLLPYPKLDLWMAF